MFDEGVPFVDVRKNSDWEAGRVPEAYHIELKTVFNKSELAKVVNSDEKVVIYCNGPKCLRSSKASAMAVEWGYTNVHYFRDGFPSWKAAEYPVE
jgi:rhodanese-related sulfurtransferase